MRPIALRGFLDGAGPGCCKASDVGRQSRFLNRRMRRLVAHQSARQKFRETLPLPPSLNLSQTKLLLTTHVGRCAANFGLPQFQAIMPLASGQGKESSVHRWPARRGMRRASQRGAWGMARTYTRPRPDWIAGVGTFVGTLHQNGGKWRAILLGTYSNSCRKRLITSN